MAIRESTVEKIKGFLKKQDVYVSLSFIERNLLQNWQSIQKVLDALVKANMVNVIDTNSGKVYKWKEVAK